MKTITLILSIVFVAWGFEQSSWDSQINRAPQDKEVEKELNKIPQRVQQERVRVYKKKKKRKRSKAIWSDQYPLSPCHTKFAQDYNPPTINDVDTLYQFSLLAKALETKDENLKQEFLYEWLQYSDSLCATQKSNKDPVLAEILLLYKAFYEEAQIYFFLSRAVKVFGSYNSIFIHNDGRGNISDTADVVKDVLLSELDYANIFIQPPKHRVMDPQIVVRIRANNTNKNSQEKQNECFQYDIFSEARNTQIYFTHGPYDSTLRAITNNMVLKGDKEPIAFLTPEIPLRLAHWGKSYWYITLPYSISGIVFNKSLNKATIKWRASPSIHGEAKFKKIFGKWIMTSKRWTGME